MDSPEIKHSPKEECAFHDKSSSLTREKTSKRSSFLRNIYLYGIGAIIPLLIVVVLQVNFAEPVSDVAGTRGYNTALDISEKSEDDHINTEDIKGNEDKKDEVNDNITKANTVEKTPKGSPSIDDDSYKVKQKKLPAEKTNSPAPAVSEMGQKTNNMQMYLKTLELLSKN